MAPLNLYLFVFRFIWLTFVWQLHVKVTESLVIFTFYFQGWKYLDKCTQLSRTLIYQHLRMLSLKWVEELIWTYQGRVEQDVLGCESRKGCSDSLVHLFLLLFLSPSFLCRRLSFPVKRFYTSLLTPFSSLSFNSSLPHRDALICGFSSVHAS